MEFKTFLLLFFVYLSASAVNGNLLRCEFSQAVDYTCTIRNAEVAADEDVLGFIGDHMPGMTDSQVQRVVFQNSKIHTIPEQLFSTFVNLRELRASRTEMEEVRMMTNCPNLVVLDVSFNRLTSLPNGVFDACSKLEQINLGYNRLGNLNQNLFANLPNLSSLGLNSIGMTVFDFYGLDNITSISLSQNSLNVLTSEMLNSIRNVDTLILTQNGISYLDKEILSPLKNIKTLLLSQNFFPVLAGDTFHNNPKLSLLSLNFNQINAMERNFFDGLPDLAYLEMTSNACITRKFFPKQEGVARVKELLEPCFRNFDQMSR